MVSYVAECSCVSEGRLVVSDYNGVFIRACFPANPSPSSIGPERGGDGGCHVRENMDLECLNSFGELDLHSRRKSFRSTQKRRKSDLFESLILCPLFVLPFRAVFNRFLGRSESFICSHSLTITKNGLLNFSVVKCAFSDDH